MLLLTLPKFYLCRVAQRKKGIWRFLKIHKE